MFVQVVSRPTETVRLYQSLVSFEPVLRFWFTLSPRLSHNSVQVISQLPAPYSLFPIPDIFPVPVSSWVTVPYPRQASQANPYHFPIPIRVPRGHVIKLLMSRDRVLVSRDQESCDLEGIARLYDLPCFLCVRNSRIELIWFRLYYKCARGALGMFTLFCS